MKPSLAAGDFSIGSLSPGFIKLADLGAFVRQRELHPGSGLTATVPGQQIRSLLRSGTMEEIERQVNALAVAVRDAGMEKEVRLREAVENATTATDGYRLHYMAAMFMHQKSVVRALARNPSLAERTQFQIAQDSVLQKDRETLLALAHNPALTSRVMRTLLSNNHDPYVWHGVARNAAFQSRKDPNDQEFAALCEEFLLCWDHVVADSAIPGIKNGELLRDLYVESNSLLAPERLEKIAQNPYTPDDVLAKMSEGPFASIQRAFGHAFPEQARLTLSAKHQALRADTSPSLAM